MSEPYTKPRRWPLLVALLVLSLILLPFAFAVPDIPAAELRAKYTTPASEFVAAAPGLEVHVRDEGPRDAVPVVLIHGSSSSLQTWEPWVARLKDRYRVITLDLPGHGLTGPSPTRDYSAAGMGAAVTAVAAAKGLDRFVIGGNSMGGWVAWTWAAANPQRVLGLILVDAAGAVTKAKPDLPIGFRIARTPVVRDVVKNVTPRSMIERSIEQTVADPNTVTPAMVDRYWELLRYPGNRDATIDRFSAERTPSDSRTLAAITVPALILWGAKDKLIPVEAAAWFDGALPDARVVIYDDVGHIPMEEAPDRSAADVAAFLAGIAAAQTGGQPASVSR